MKSMTDAEKKAKFKQDIKDQTYKEEKFKYEQRKKGEKGSSANKKINKFFDGVGDKMRNSRFGEGAREAGTGTSSRDDEAQMRARKEVYGYAKGGMAKKGKDMKGMKKMAKGGMACGSKKYAKGGKVRGAGCAKKGVRPCKMV